MKDDIRIKTAIKLLYDGALTFCALNENGGEILKSRDRGVKPLVSLIDSGVKLIGFCAADKVIGKAAAFLYVILEPDFVYADVISEKAYDVFKVSGIEVSFGKKVEAIRNRTNTGFCPMETAVEDISDPYEALIAIRKKMDDLSGGKKQINK